MSFWRSLARCMPLGVPAVCTSRRAFFYSSPVRLTVKRVVRKKKKIVRETAVPVPVTARVEPSPRSATPLAPVVSTAESPPVRTPPQDPHLHQQLARRLEKVNEMTHQIERAVRVCSEAIGLAQRQLTVLDRRLVAIEQAVEAMQSSGAASRRTIGEVVLEQRNTELLVRQMEQRVLQGHASHPTHSAADTTNKSTEASQTGNVRTRDDEEAEQEEEAEEDVVMGEEELHARIRTLVDEAVQKALASVPAPQASPLSSSAGTTQLAGEVALLSRRLEAMSLEHLALARVGPAVVEATTAADTADTTHARRAQLADVAATLHAAASQPFKDVTGASRLRSEKIVLRNVPRNLSAAEVRALCAAKLDGAPHGARVLSCVVAQHALPPSPPLSHPDHHQSGQHTRPQSDESSVPSAADLARVVLVPNSKTFDIVFDSPETARRALVALNRTSLKPAAHLPSQQLVAEPAVSAEFLDALAGATVPDKGHGKE